MVLASKASWGLGLDIQVAIAVLTCESPPLVLLCASLSGFVIVCVELKQVDFPVLARQVKQYTNRVVRSRPIHVQRSGR
jgi:hypothetical protein